MEESENHGVDILGVFTIGTIITVVLYVIRQWIKGKQFTEKVNGRNKIAVVTGASSGIGKQLVRELTLRYVKVYMMCRDVNKGKCVARELFARYGCDATKIVVIEGDLSNFESIRNFVKNFSNEEEQLDILINNAGVMFYPKFEQTVDGYEMTWQTNYLGHFLLTELLLPKLEKSTEGRIINVSSRLHLYADTVDTDICNSKRYFDRFYKTYARSKLANVMHAVALTNRIRSKNNASKITINSCHPGTVNTNLVRIAVFQKIIKKIFAPFIWFLMKTDQDGAQTPLYLALSKKVIGISGKYFSDCSFATTHLLAEDETACEILYNSSIEACRLYEQRY